MYTLRTLAKRDHCHRLWLKRATSSGLNNDLNSSICIKKNWHNKYKSTIPNNMVFLYPNAYAEFKICNIMCLVEEYILSWLPVCHRCFSSPHYRICTAFTHQPHQQLVCKSSLWTLTDTLPECCMQLVRRTFQHLVYLIACIQPCLYLTCTCFHLLVNLPAFCPWPQVCLCKGIIRDCLHFCTLVHSYFLTLVYISL